jgi:hypothetical protein
LLIFWNTLGILHIEVLHNLYSSPIIIWVIKSQKMWVGHVACMGEKRYIQGLVEKPEGK